MKTVADVLREEGRKIERERLQKIESELRLEKERSQKTESELNNEHNEIITIVKRLLKRNMSIETIHEITDIPVNEILQIQRNLDN